ncbi:MAG: zinc metalloprotease, partial [Cyclobacteriaceae bacterium]|nr:zinc metalloprotease [Cyclobacteriaceae bacterium]
GSGINIPYEQILSQITVLNEDFRRTNPDKADTPAEFLPVAADTEIEFVLAKQDPDGLPTNGINRVKGDKSFWLWTEQSWLKQQSYWPAEDYLNIWVCDIGSESGQNILGYATYPVSGLEGLNFATNNRLTDGVVVDYKVFGSSVLFPAGNYTANYDRGRTLTHELGHFFGLRHIWGDASDCIASDYCVDTPSQDVSTTGCPGSKSSCSVSNMISNYMDYTYDACMNIFTLDQTDRMRTVLSFSPRRLSLTTSHGLVAPTTYSNDLAITSINQPGGSVCISSIIPEITISNIGNNDISSASVNIFKDGLFIESKSISSTLAVSGATVLQFSPLSLTPGTRHLIQFEIQSVNGGTDPNPLKNVDSVSLVVPVQAAIPVYETMEIYPSSWIIEDYDQSISWTQVFAPNGNVGNKAMMMDFYNYEIIGETDAFISPAINLQNTSTAFLSFDVAYAPYPGSFSDGLIVGVLSDCNMTMASMDTIYYKSGDILATTAGITYSYKPQSITDWRNESFIDLSAHIGKANVQIVFLGINGYGNNLYIDNIYLTTDKTEDITITEVLNPPKYSCSPASEMKIEIKNNGIDPLQSFDFHYSLDGSVTISQSYSGLNILPGEFYTILINPMDYSTGNHSLSILFDVPNGKNDMAPFDNAVDWNFKVSDYSEIIPHRQDFENTGNAEWYWDPNWKYSTFQSGTVLKLPAYNAGQKGKTSWLVSPTFDFSTIEKASLFFDVAYSSGLSSFETLKVLLSTDCGNTYPHLLYEKSGDLLASASYEANFTPDFLSDWRNEYINLSNFVGETEVKIAFM